MEPFSKRILLVDDEEEIRRGAGMWLSRVGYRVSSAADGEEAVAAASQEHPDAIVMDVRMPRKDGLTALTELKQRHDTRKIPIVMLSASLVDKDRTLDLGASFFLTKPYQGKKLIEAVNVAVGREREG